MEESTPQRASGATAFTSDTLLAILVAVRGSQMNADERATIRDAVLDYAQARDESARERIGMRISEALEAHPKVFHHIVTSGAPAAERANSAQTATGENTQKPLGRSRTSAFGGPTDLPGTQSADADRAEDASPATDSAAEEQQPHEKKEPEMVYPDDTKTGSITNESVTAPAADTTPAETSPDAPAETEASQSATTDASARIREIKHTVNETYGNPVNIIETHPKEGRAYMNALLTAMKAEANNTLSEKELDTLEAAFADVKKLDPNAPPAQEEETAAPAQTPERAAPKQTPTPTPAAAPNEQHDDPGSDEQKTEASKVEPAPDAPASAPTTPAPEQTAEQKQDDVPRVGYGAASNTASEVSATTDAEAAPHTPEPTPPTPPTPTTPPTPDAPAAQPQETNDTNATPGPTHGAQQAPEAPAQPPQPDATPTPDTTPTETTQNGSNRSVPIRGIHGSDREDTANDAHSAPVASAFQNAQGAPAQQQTTPQQRPDAAPQQSDSALTPLSATPTVTEAMQSAQQEAKAAQPATPASGDPLHTPDVDEALNQLLSAWRLFKRSGFMGTGPNGAKHPLYLKLKDLPMAAVVSGRFEGATQEVKQNITDYLNGWRYEYDIVHELDETFEHYLRRVLAHIIRVKKVDEQTKQNAPNAEATMARQQG